MQGQGAAFFLSGGIDEVRHRLGAIGKGQLCAKANPEILVPHEFEKLKGRETVEVLFGEKFSDFLRLCRGQ